MNKIGNAGNREEFFQKYVDNRDKAKKVFGAPVGDKVVMAATLNEIDIPDRVGGHDNKRGQASSKGQMGKGKAANDHGKAQGKNVRKWKNNVEMNPADCDRAKSALKEFKEFESLQKELDELESESKDTTLCHNKEKKKEVAEQKQIKRQKKESEKKDLYETRQASDEIKGDSLGVSGQIPTKREFDFKLCECSTCINP